GARTTSHGMVSPSMTVSVSTAGPSTTATPSPAPIPGVAGKRLPGGIRLVSIDPDEPPGRLLCAQAVSGTATVTAAAAASPARVRGKAGLGTAAPGSDDSGKG